MVASIVQELHRRLMPLLDNHHTSSLTYWPCCKRRNQAQKPLNIQFRIVVDEKTLPWCWNASRRRLKVDIWTCPDPDKHFIISWWLIISPTCGPRAINHMNYLPGKLTTRHRYWHCVLPNVFCNMEITEILIAIVVVCEVDKSLETTSDVIL